MSDSARKPPFTTGELLQMLRQRDSIPALDENVSQLSRMAGNRDTAATERLGNLDDAFSVFRCHGIMNCVNVCPKGLNPTKAIGQIKSMLLNRAV